MLLTKLKIAGLLIAVGSPSLSTFAQTVTPSAGVETTGPQLTAESSVLVTKNQPKQRGQDNANSSATKLSPQANLSQQAKLSQQDRYRRHNGEWWYRNDNQTWSYHRNGEWSTYDQNTYRRPPGMRIAPERQTVYVPQQSRPVYRSPGYRSNAPQSGYYEEPRRGYAQYPGGPQPYFRGGQPYGYSNHPYGYGGQPYGYGNQPYGYGGQRYGTGYRGYQGGYIPQSREGRTGAAIGGIIGGREGAAIGGFIGEASRD